MPDALTPTVEAPKPFDFAKFQKERADGTRLDPAAAAVAETPKPAAVETPAPVKRASGDERKFRTVLKRELAAVRAELEALRGQQAKPADTAAAATPAAGAAPERKNFATDAEYEEARIAHVAQKKIDETKAADQQAAEIRDAIDAYNERMKRGPQKYEDWDEVLKNGSGAALSVDLSKECPALFWAITQSPYNDDCFYHWLKDSKQLQGLIDIYKSGPKGEMSAIAAFHRFEGHVGKDSVPEKKDQPASKKDEGKEAPKKADDAARAPKPKPSAEASVRGGASAPDGPPSPTLSDGSLNPAWKAFRAAQERR